MFCHIYPKFSFAKLSLHAVEFALISIRFQKKSLEALGTSCDGLLKSKFCNDLEATQSCTKIVFPACFILLQGMLIFNGQHGSGSYPG